MYINISIRPICLFVFLFGGITDTIDAQTRAGLGVRTGVVFSNFTQSSFDFDSNTDGWVTLSLEVTSETSSLFFVTELSYKGLGANRTDRVVNGPGDTRTQFDANYIGISPMAGVVVFEDKKLSPRFYLGPNIDILTDSKLVFRRPGGVIGGFDIGGDTNNAIFGFNIGAGLDWKLGPVGFTIDGRYTTTFSTVYNESLLEGALDDVKHEYFGVIFGLHFPFSYK